MSKKVSFSRSKDYLDVRVFSDGKIVFKGGCPIGDESKLKSLFSVLKAKGYLDGVTVKDNWW